jgi:hypothetical protein
MKCINEKVQAQIDRGLRGGKINEKKTLTHIFLSFIIYFDICCRRAGIRAPWTHYLPIYKRY